MIVASQIFQPDFKENDAELLGCVLHTIILHPFFLRQGWVQAVQAVPLPPLRVGGGGGSQGTCEGQGPSIRKRCVKLFGTA